MKTTVLVLVMALCFAGNIFPQLAGGFFYGYSDGNPYVYFEGENISGKDLRNFKVVCINDALGQHQEFNIGILYKGNSIKIGPSNGWIWQDGERVCLTYGDCPSVCWIYTTGPGNRSFADPRLVPGEPHNEGYIRARIRELEYKIDDAERSLREYERSYRKNPSVSGFMLISSQRRLIGTYRDQLMDLISQLY